MPGEEELPSTLERSDDKAQRTWIATHDSAVETYGEGERAHRTAFAALKHTHEKVGDHWEPKDEKGPSDPAAKVGGRNDAPTFGGVDYEGSTREELYERAKELDIDGRSSMTKAELAEAIDKANQRETERARRDDR